MWETRVSGALRLQGPEDVAEWCQARVVGWQEEVFVFDLSCDGLVVKGDDAGEVRHRVVVLAWPGFSVPVGPAVAMVILAAALRVLGPRVLDVILVDRHRWWSLLDVSRRP
jgi:hypothetical protein